MERSDPPRPAVANTAAANSEPAKPAADGTGLPPDESPVDSPAEAEPDTIERAHFEALDRETTQPVRRYPQAPVDVAHAVDYQPPTPVAADAPPSEEPVPSWTHVLEEALTPPTPGKSPAEQPSAQSTPAEPEEISAPASPDGPSAAAEPLIETPWPDPLETTPPSAADPAAEPAEANYFTVEPVPFAVLPPSDRRPPIIPQAAPAPIEQVPPRDEPAAAEPPLAEPVLHEPVRAGPVAHEPYQSKPEPEPEPEPQSTPHLAPPAQSVRLQHDIAAAWSPPRPMRREPTFERSEPALRSAAVASPNTQQAPARDYRDMVRRTANVAFLVFCGWFIAVLLLIAAYRFINPPVSALMALQWVSGTPIHKQWVPLERISPNLTRAVIVAEDGRFCQHWGVDFVEAANAIRRATDGYPRGASTITMQVAKNLFLLPTKSYLRKLIEIPLTFAIELAWPKWRILEVYLNIVEWGPGIFGAEAASRAHFGRSAAGLSTRQAAQLAVVLPNPIVRDAGSPSPRTAHRASVIQARAARNREASFCVDRRR
ncbi:MAG: monofunctional biosynthetic peptidoglycan transglycosylase [Hyphomicrobium sp.]|uniref:monofunctional biosynthetic peptidoglycan transglycosylase n=1 Tax=Hyphomicrobium sp. TaxID=82 RepID=UPI0025BA0400|nr:monofunctional biosynthetic peptidoglycan transglycosylase [Hyphomicrobium sp.]MBZ0208265.1 monofunctional biosynthetic peptidoglycan transglycosylase [Hyphomicrobium sp.]